MDRVLNSRFALNFASFVAQSTPPWLGYRVAWLGMRWITAHKNSKLYRAVRSNQWVITGEKCTSAELDRYVETVFYNSGRSLYDLYHFGRNLEKAGKMFVIDPSFRILVDRDEFAERGIVAVGLHMSSFDLALQWLCLKWMKPLALTISNPQGGRLLEFENRRRMGMNLVPASVTGIRQAVRHLQQGGMVMTGIDRPEPQSQIQVRFFGRLAHMPVPGIYLALKTDVPVVVGGCCKQADGLYHIFGSEPIEMEHCANRDDELLRNAERVLAVSERFIRQTPQQWTVPSLVWPETQSLMPG